MQFEMRTIITCYRSVGHSNLKNWLSGDIFETRANLENIIGKGISDNSMELIYDLFIAFDAMHYTMRTNTTDLVTTFKDYCSAEMESRIDTGRSLL